MRAIPRAQLGPFDQAVALASSVLPLCVGWPNASPDPLPPAPVPPVPTLIVSGGADVRTPTRDARALAARIAGAQLLEVPFVGHSTIGADPTGCTKAGVAAFFAGQPVPPCTAAAPQFPPTRIPPTRLARVPGAGRAGKTIRAAEETLEDVGQLFGGIAVQRRKAPRIGTRSAACAAAPRAGRPPGPGCGASQYVPGVARLRVRAARGGRDDATHRVGRRRRARDRAHPRAAAASSPASTAGA